MGENSEMDCVCRKMQEEMCYDEVCTHPVAPKTAIDMLRAELDRGSCAVEVRVCRNELLDTSGAKALLTATNASATSTVGSIIDHTQKKEMGADHKFNFGKLTRK
jgi:hypothetical protein